MNHIIRHFLLLCLSFTSFYSASYSQCFSYDVKVCIDGSDKLHIKGNKMWWQHVYAQNPGQHTDCSNFGTTISVNGNLWNPWDSAYVINDVTCCALSVKKIQCYYNCTLTQTPDSANGWETIFFFDDSIPLGPHYYDVEFTFCHNCSCNSGNNLIVNGDFSQWNTGFTSSYTYTNAANGLVPAGYYAVGPDVLYYHSGASGSMYDHTLGTSAGSYFMGNGGAVSNTPFWCETVPVKPNTDYIFSAWQLNWSKLATTNLAEFQTTINGAPLPGIDTVPAANYIWKQFMKPWNSGSNTSATICLTDLQLLGYGSDFGLDDIVFQECNSSIKSLFISSDTAFCSEGGACINFFDLSTGNPTSWQWKFPGALPDTSTQQNPSQICYSIPGTYPVTLITSNINGSDTLIVSPLITFATGASKPVINLSNDTLYSTHATSYQWYFNGVLIGGATDSFYIFMQEGSYSVMITDSLRCQAISDGVVLGALPETAEAKISFFINYSNHTIHFKSKITSADLFDISGRKIPLTMSVDGRSASVPAVSSGVYIIHLRNTDTDNWQKLLIE